jgi:hypothetical protein
MTEWKIFIGALFSAHIEFWNVSSFIEIHISLLIGTFDGF